MYLLVKLLFCIDEQRKINESEVLVVSHGDGQLPSERAVHTENTSRLRRRLCLHFPSTPGAEEGGEITMLLPHCLVSFILATCKKTLLPLSIERLPQGKSELWDISGL